MELNIICLETEAYYKLLEEMVDFMREKVGKPLDDWVDAETAMKILNISSKTTLQKYRDENAIRFSQPSKKVIVYYRPSLVGFLEKNASELKF